MTAISIGVKSVQNGAAVVTLEPFSTAQHNWSSRTCEKRKIEITTFFFIFFLFLSWLFCRLKLSCMRLKTTIYVVQKHKVFLGMKYNNNKNINEQENIIFII